MNTYKSYLRDGTQGKDIQTFGGPVSMAMDQGVLFYPSVDDKTHEIVYKQESIKQEKERLALAKKYKNVSNTVYIDLK